MNEEQVSPKQTDNLTYSNALSLFIDSIKSLRTFVDYIKPTLESRRVSFMEEHGKVLGTILSIAQSKIEPKESSEYLGQLEDYLCEKYNFRISSEQDTDGLKISMSRCLLSDIICEKLEEERINFAQLSLLHQSSFITLIVYFEFLISNLFRIRFLKYPDSTDISNKTLTYSQIAKFINLKDAQEFLIEEEIEKIMRDSFDKWLDYFVKNAKIKFDQLEQVKDTLIEILQRRNLIVHNGAIVNSIYTSKVNEKFLDGMNIGDTLVIDSDYINNSINTIEYAGLLIAFEIWKNAQKNDHNRFDYIEDIAYKHMCGSRYDLACSIYKFLLSESCISKKELYRTKINYWLCNKFLDKYNEIQNLVDTEDFSDKTYDLQLGYFALTNKNKEFFELLPIAFPNSISFFELLTWPIFKDIRNTDEFKEFLEKNKDKLNDHLDEVAIAKNILQ